jgi:hypothetical protein
MRLTHWTFPLVALTGCSAVSDRETTTDDAASVSVDANAAYQIVGIHSGKCVEVAGGSTSNLAQIQIAACSTDARQQFRLEPMGSGYYRIRSVNGGRCIDVSGASTADGAPAIQYTCGTGHNQQWSITDVAPSVERITARHSGKAMEVSGWSTNDGASIVQRAYQGQGNQQFNLRAVGTTPGVTSDGGGGSTGSGRIFDQCRFHFGTIDSIAKNSPGLAAQIDYFTPGWMGVSDTFDQRYVCDETSSGAVLAGKVPVVVAYVAAFYVKRHYGLCDCNVSGCGANNDLCHYGAQRIQENLGAIVDVYRSYAQGYASCYGTSRPIVFDLEPDWYQYTGSSQTRAMTAAQAGSVMSQFVGAIKQYLPNARFSMDISPWVAPNNGSDNGKAWYSNFDMSSFSFINTSGGSTEAASTRIRSSNNMTWTGVSSVTGKPILADTGYGANGVSAGHDHDWDNPTYINARMKDGVIGISQYNPSSSWGSTIQSVRSQLGTPAICP